MLFRSYVCNSNALLTYISFLWVLQVFSLIHAFRLPLPRSFFPPPTQHFLHTIHSRLKRCPVQFRMGEVQCCVLSAKMVAKINEIVDNYEKGLQEMPFIPRGSFRRRMLRQDGGSSSANTTVGKTTSTTWHSTCSWRGARRKAFHPSSNSSTSSPTPIRTCEPCQLLLPATRDHTNGHHLLQVNLLLQYVTPMTSLTLPHCVKDIMWAPLPIISVMTDIFCLGI